MGIGDWGLGIWFWGLGLGINSEFSIPNHLDPDTINNLQVEKNNE